MRADETFSGFVKRYPEIGKAIEADFILAHKIRVGLNPAERVARMDSLDNSTSANTALNRAMCRLRGTS
jgi:uncharacterized protein (DUF1778 family)